jgi:DNA-binding NarL/FixJ family response regulator
MKVATPFLELAVVVLSRDPRIFLAYDAAQAFALTRHLSGAITLVDLDLMENDGLSLIVKLRESYPEIPVIAISRLLGVP